MKLTEASFQSWLVDLAKLCRWRVYHTYDSRRSAGGFPDLVFVRPNTGRPQPANAAGRIIFAELKSETGRTSAEQREWLAALASVAGDVRCETGDDAYIEVFQWRPSDRATIEEVLR